MTEPNPLDAPAHGLDEVRTRLSSTLVRLAGVEEDQMSLAQRVLPLSADVNQLLHTVDGLEESLEYLVFAAANTPLAPTPPATPAPDIDLPAGEQLPLPDLGPAGTATTTPAGKGGGKQAQKPEPPRPPTTEQLYRWVDEHIAPLVRKTTTSGEGGGVRWCRQWWRHHDAISRFTALYWTHGELSESGEASWLSVYLRDHLDPHLAVLTSPIGPFSSCSPTRHSPVITPLEHDPLDITLPAELGALVPRPDTCTPTPPSTEDHGDPTRRALLRGEDV